jgi:hypothetical protein
MAQWIELRQAGISIGRRGQKSPKGGRRKIPGVGQVGIFRYSLLA